MSAPEKFRQGYRGIGTEPPFDIPQPESFTPTRCELEGDDDSFKSISLGYESLRAELLISRKALAEIAAPIQRTTFAEHIDYELSRRVGIARDACAAIEALKGRG